MRKDVDVGVDVRVGLYQSDLVYIKEGMLDEQRDRQVAVILRLISEFQRSRFGCSPSPSTSTSPSALLLSIRYSPHFIFGHIQFHSSRMKFSLNHSLVSLLIETRFFFFFGISTMRRCTFLYYSAPSMTALLNEHNLS